MVKISPTVDADEVELSRKLRHACPRIKRWKTRIDDADGDVHRMREQAITKSPVYVAIQRGSKNILIRTRTKPKWWRKWIQEGKKYGFDESFSTPIHIPSDAYRYQRQVSLSKKSPEKSPRRSLPVSPIKTGIHSPIKVSVLKNEDYIRSPKKSPQHQKGVPMLMLTPVPLNQVLKKKARLVGNISTLGKGRWVEQDSSMLAVPGKEVYQYDSSSEAETDTEGVKRDISTDVLKRVTSAKRRETPPSPKSPKRSPKKEPLEEQSGSELSGSEQEDRYYSPTTQRLKKKIRAAGQTSLYFSPNRKLDEEVIEESEEDMEGKSPRARSAIKKIKAMGTVKAALSPHKSPKKSPEAQGRSPDSIKRKIKAIGKTSAAFSPKKGGEEEEEDEDFIIDNDGNIIPSPKRSTRGSTTLGSFLRKIRIIGRLSTPTKTAKGGGLGSLITKMRILVRLSPRRSKRSDSIEESSEEELEKPKEGGFMSLMAKLRFLSKVSPRRKKAHTTEGETTEGEEEGVDRKVEKQEKIQPKEVEEVETSGEEEAEDKVEKESCFKTCFRIVCPCIASRKEPELMEYQSGSQANY